MTRGLIIAAASSHSGKTVLTLGLIAALSARGLRVAAAKCGPDFIDPKFLAAASGGAAINLDPWAMTAEGVRTRLARHAEGADLVIVEGVMGLYDGAAGGAGSTASLARATGLPVVLVVGASGMAQSAAAIAEGFARMADGFAVVGAIVNHVASERHAAMVREGFTRSAVPLLGLVRRDAGVALASRHLGLVQAEEHADLAATAARAGGLVAEGCDLAAVLGVAGSVPREVERGLRQRVDVGSAIGPSPDPPLTRRATLSPLGRGPGNAAPYDPSPLPGPPPQGGREGVEDFIEGDAGLAPLGGRVAVARDVAFGFAYPHLLADWRGAGAEISFFSPLADEASAGDADAVFLPGGYPELHAGALAAAGNFRAGMHAAAARGALIYGECGGYMALGEALVDASGASHRMLGLLPLVTSFAERRLHLGYRRLTPLGGLPWRGAIAAHEFHFASIVSEGEGERLFDAADAAGIALGAIGLRRGRVMGSFAHAIDAM